MGSDEDPPWLPGVFAGPGRDGLRIPARLVAYATLAHTRLGGLHVADLGSDVAPQPGPYTAVLCDGGAFHYFHLVESVCWLWTIQHVFLGGRAPARIVLSIAWDDPRQCGIGRELIAALYPGAEVLDPNSPGWPRLLQHTLVVHRSWAELRVNKYLEAAMGLAPLAMREMAAVVRLACGAHQGKSRAARILYVTRPPPRCLAPGQEAVLLRALSANWPCSVVDFASLPWAQQVRHAAAHDVMISVHGNGLTNASWMRPGSLVVELFPPGMRAYDFQFTAELFGLAYAGFEGDLVFAAGDRTPQYGTSADSRRPVLQLDVVKIIAVISAFLRSAG